MKKTTDKFTNKDAELLLNSLHDTYLQASDNAKKIINMSFRNVLYVLSESRPADFVSKSAQKIWNKSGIQGNLHNLLVAKKRAIQKDYPELKELLLEHCVPLSELCHAFMDDGKSVKYILNNLKTAWITKTENSRLNKACRSNRQDWKTCYMEHKIELDIGD
ncbi:MAG: hypothetical protein J5608_03200 [Alphaproteobacteria bacterium]|nr:hypothetical protein [Alphaproteobacteria bacterium]